jgi:hypothetical protein
MSTAFNISKHKIGWYFEQAEAGGTAALILVLLKATGLEADATIADHDNVSVLLAGTSDQADFTNYARKTVSGSTIDVNFDDTNNRVLLDMPDQTWTAAGGATNNALGALLIAFDANTGAGTDTDLVPLLKLDFTATTDGNDLILRFHADGAARVA